LTSKGDIVVAPDSAGVDGCGVVKVEIEAGGEGSDGRVGIGVTVRVKVRDELGPKVGESGGDVVQEAPFFSSVLIRGIICCCRCCFRLAPRFEDFRLLMISQEKLLRKGGTGNCLPFTDAWAASYIMYLAAVFFPEPK
jgi:hypothetical protein